MPQPDIRASLVSLPLQNASVAYKNKSYIADRVFPILPVKSPVAKITTYGKGAWFRDEAAIRAPGTRAARGGYNLSTVAISTDDYAYAKAITRKDLANAGVEGAPGVDMIQDAIEFTADKIDLSKEVRVSALIRAATWVDGNSGGEDAAGLWAAGGSNTFLADITTGKKAIRSSTGVLPNKLLIDFATMESLKSEATLLDKIKYVQRGVLTEELLASLLGLDEVIVGSAIKSSANETKAGTDFTAANIWETNANKGMGFLFFAPPRPGLKTPSAGYQARLEQPLTGMGRVTRNWYEDAEDQWVYETSEETDILTVSTGSGYLWVDTFAT